MYIHAIRSSTLVMCRHGCIGFWLDHVCRVIFCGVHVECILFLSTAWGGLQRQVCWREPCTAGLVPKRRPRDHHGGSRQFVGCCSRARLRRRYSQIICRREMWADLGPRRPSHAARRQWLRCSIDTGWSIALVATLLVGHTSWKGDRCRCRLSTIVMSFAGVNCEIRFCYTIMVVWQRVRACWCS